MWRKPNRSYKNSKRKKQQARRHSLPGLCYRPFYERLVARYAVQALGVSEVDKIITLDTEHHGFDLAAIVDNIFVDPLTKLIPPPTRCCIDAAPNSKFVNDLNSGLLLALRRCQLLHSTR